MCVCGKHATMTFISSILLASICEPYTKGQRNLTFVTPAKEQLLNQYCEPVTNQLGKLIAFNIVNTPTHLQRIEAQLYLDWKKNRASAFQHVIFQQTLVA